MSCATEPCDQVEACCLEGGCIVRSSRWPQPLPRTSAAHVDEGLRDDAPALNGTKPSRVEAHPSTFKRRRKELVPYQRST